MVRIVCPDLLDWIGITVFIVPLILHIFFAFVWAVVRLPVWAVLQPVCIGVLVLLGKSPAWWSKFFKVELGIRILLCLGFLCGYCPIITMWDRIFYWITVTQLCTVPVFCFDRYLWQHCPQDIENAHTLSGPVINVAQVSLIVENHLALRDLQRIVFDYCGEILYLLGYYARDREVLLITPTRLYIMKRALKIDFLPRELQYRFIAHAVIATRHLWATMQRKKEASWIKKNTSIPLISN